MNTRKIVAAVAAVALVALVFSACPNDDGGGGNNTVTSLVEMKWIDGGTFTMGSDDSQDFNASPSHQVTLTKGFYMGKYEVTQAQYEEVMGSNPSNFATDVATGEAQGKRPVEMVSWYDAIVFCNKLSIKEGLTPAYQIDGKTNPDEWGAVPTSSDATWNAVEIVTNSTGYRLPTEAQWEYACRAGTTTAYNTGDTISDDTGWYSDNSDSKTHEVGKKPANAFGLHDMHGNVGEWCWDWFDVYDSNALAQTDPDGVASGARRVARGGSWGHDGQVARSAYRNADNPGGRNFYLGFRLVRPAQ